jgi:hypothetical protein
MVAATLLRRATRSSSSRRAIGRSEDSRRAWAARCASCIFAPSMTLATSGARRVAVDPERDGRGPLHHAAVGCHVHRIPALRHSSSINNDPRPKGRGICLAVRVWCAVAVSLVRAAYVRSVSISSATLWWTARSSWRWVSNENHVQHSVLERRTVLRHIPTHRCPPRMVTAQPLNRSRHQRSCDNYPDTGGLVDTWCAARERSIWDLTDRAFETF